VYKNRTFTLNKTKPKTQTKQNHSAEYQCKYHHHHQRRAAKTTENHVKISQIVYELREVMAFKLQKFDLCSKSGNTNKIQRKFSKTKRKEDVKR